LPPLRRKVKSTAALPLTKIRPAIVALPIIDGGRVLFTIVVEGATVGAKVGADVEVRAAVVAGVVERVGGVEVETAVAVAALVRVGVGGTAVAVGGIDVTVGVAVGATFVVVAVGGTRVGVADAPRTVVETELDEPEKIPIETEA